MITYVPVSDPYMADELRKAGLLYCGYPCPSLARKHWDWDAILTTCSAYTQYFCYALEE